MTIDSRTDERCGIDGILRGPLLKISEQFRFCERFREIQQAPQPEFRRNTGKKLLNGIDAYSGQHSLAVGSRVRDISN
jgi:hypothetical protein